ncbi:Uncharacterised protein [Segatella copri]|nr:Uncharacterised protein [Segatella copri]
MLRAMKLRLRKVCLLRTALGRVRIVFTALIQQLRLRRTQT